MNRLTLSASCLALTACVLIDKNGVGVSYQLEPEEFARDFGASTGTFPDVDCSGANAMACAQAPAPSGSTASCDPVSKRCVATIDLRLVQQVNLSQEKAFPSSVANSSVVNYVTVNAVHYWTPSNTLSFDSPPIDLYVGGQAAQKETDAGVALLGTVPSLPKAMRTACGSGAAGTSDSECDMPLTDAGSSALALLAKDYRTPFNVIVVAHVTVRGGDPLPAGALDLFVQPVVAFEIPF